MKALIKGLRTYKKEIDATQIAEILWLSQFMDKSPFVEPKPIEEKLKTVRTSTLPKDVSHKVVIEPASKKEKEKPKTNEEELNYGFTKFQECHSFYTVDILEEMVLPKIEKQFYALKVKQKKLSTKILDEVKTSEYLSNTGFFNPIFKEETSRERYFSLHIIVDRSDAYFLWEALMNHFLKSIGFSSVFTNVKLFYMDSSQDEPLFYAKNKKRHFSSNSSVFYEKNALTLVFSDVIGQSWKSNVMFQTLDAWSKNSFVAIVSMLPKRMWQRTPLKKGLNTFLTSHKFLAKNSDLQEQISFVQKRVLNHSKIPILPFDGQSFSSLSNILIAKKGSWIDARVFKKRVLTQKEKVVQEQQNNFTAKERVDAFFASVLPETWELAIYSSVLPLNKEIIDEVIKVKRLDRSLDAFSEFYFGGLLDKNIKVNLGSYEFYDGIRELLWEYISDEEMMLLWKLLSDVIAQSLGLKCSIQEILYAENKSLKILGDKEKKLAKLLMSVLKEKGKIYKQDVNALREKIDVIYPKTNTYQMGSNDGYDDEKPVHSITFDHDFEIAKTQVTFEEYDLYCEDTEAEKPSDEGWGRGKRPVINVSWDDTQAYCKWLSKETSKEYRLPTEAEWEYACRAGTSTKWSFGDDEKELGKYAWYSENSNSKTHEVATKKENSWGLHDMHGNVREWCQDDWVDNYENTPRDGTAYKKSKNSSKVLRGGSWIYNATLTRSAYRYFRSPTSRDDVDGFRLLRTLP